MWCILQWEKVYIKQNLYCVSFSFFRFLMRPLVKMNCSPLHLTLISLHRVDRAIHRVTDTTLKREANFQNKTLFLDHKIFILLNYKETVRMGKS